MDSDGTLPSALFTLSKTAQEIVEEEDYDPVRNEVAEVSVDYDYSPSGKSLRRTTENTTRMEWSQQVHSDVYDKVRETDAYQKAHERVEEIGDQPAEYLIRQFVRNLMDELLYGLDDNEIAEMITIFVSDIEESPINWDPVILFNGVEMGQEEVVLDSGIVLRQPVSEDVERMFDENPYRHISLGGHPTAVLEFSKRTSDRSDIHRIVDKVIITLEMFETASVTVIHKEYNPETIVRDRRHLNRERTTKRPTPFSYTLDGDNESRLLDSFEVISKEIEEKILAEPKDTPINIAYDRYSNALDDISTERRITSAIMCLEALLLKENERGELSERLSRRSSILLHQFDFEPMKVRSKLSEAYKIRSSYVHGSGLDTSTNLDFAEDIVNYARILINIYLQIETEKDDLISKVDNASIHPNARDKTQELLEQECEIAEFYD